MQLAEKDGKKEKILEAAVNIFSGKLFHQVKMEEIASQAGVGKGTLYLYFESKEELFRQTLRYATDLYYFKLKESLEKIDSPREKLHEVASLQINFLQEHLKLIYLLAGESMAPPLIFQEEIHKARKKLLSLLEGVILEGIKRGEFRSLDATLAARVYLGGIISLLHDIFNEDEIVEDGDLITERFTELYLKGFENEEGKREKKGEEK